MKRNLQRFLMAALAALLGTGAWAQTDVTSTYLTNADFEGEYSKDHNPQGNTTRAIYVPTGWTLSQSGENTNDFTGFKSGDLQFADNFASGKVAQPTDGGSQTLWTRLRWGGQVWSASGSTGSPDYIKFSQTVTLPNGVYKLSADMFCYSAGSEANNHVYLGVENGNQVEATFNRDKTTGSWENKSVDFISAGNSEATVYVQTLQNWQVELISGFDNIKLAKYEVSSESPYDMTSFANNTTDGWSINSSNNNGTADCNGTTLVERYYDNHYTGKVTDQTINVPNGIYNVEVYCHAYCAAWNCTAVSEADGQTGYTQLSVNEEIQGIPVHNSKTFLDGTPDTYTFNNVKVIDGKLVFTVTNLQEAANWITIGIKSISYLGESDEKTYTVGNATANSTFQAGQTITVTYPEALTDDGDASFALADGATATFNGQSVSLTASSNGFSFVVPAGTYTSGTDYTLEVAAGTIGYAEHAMNEAQTITISTPAVFDGTYFLSDGNGKYISRGGDSNTEAALDEYGIAVKVATGTDGLSTFQFVDNSKYMFASTSSMYTDKDALEANYYYTIAKTDNGYSIYSSNKSKYIVPGTGAESKAAAATMADEAIDWTFVTPTEHATAMVALKNAQAAAAATGKGLTATTPTELATAVASLTSKDVTVSALSANTEFYSDASNTGNAVGTRKNTVNLQAGLYKMTIPAYTRQGFPDVAYNLHAAGSESPVTYVYLGTAKTQVMSLYDGTGKDEETSNYVKPANASQWYPNSTGTGTTEFSAGQYVNTIWVYISEAGDYEYGITNPSKGQCGEWTWFGTPTLTYYCTEMEAAKADLASAIAAAPAVPTANISESDAFTFKKSEVDALKSAIETAQGVYDSESSTLDDVKAQITAVEALVAPSVNQPAEAVNTYIQLIYSGWTYDKKVASAYVNSSAQGGYSMGYFDFGAQKYQLWTITPTDDGYVTLSFTDADDATRYMCTGVPYSGNTLQIRSTTEAASALKISVIPSYTVEGIVTLYNTEAKVYIGSQDQGVYTVNSHNDFKLVIPTIALNTEKTYTTYCNADFALDFTDNADVEAYTAKYDSESKNVVLTQVYKVPARTGVILKNLNGASSASVNVVSSADALENNELVGATSATTLTYEDATNSGYYNYVLSAGEFHPVTDNTTLAAGKAYLSCAYNVNEVGAKALNIVFADDATAIKSVSNSANNGAVYNLTGQRVAANAKGIVIINGKKYLNK